MAASQKQEVSLLLPGLAAVLVALQLGLTASISPIGAQEPYAGDYQSYPLRHALASEVRNMLAAMLPQGSDVAADERANRVWVRGPSQAHQIVQKVVGSLDRAGTPQEEPSAAKSPSVPATPPVLKVLACPPGKLAAVAAGLLEEFGKLPGVRIVPDPRTSQLLVLAPAEVQPQIAARVEPLAKAAVAAATGSPDEPSGPPSEGLPAPRVGQPLEIQLAVTTADRLASNLGAILGDQLVPIASTPEASTYRILFRSGGGIDLAINHRTNRVVLTGTGATTTPVLQLIRVLDAPAQESDRGTTRLVPLRATRPADVQRTIEAIRMAGVSRERQAPAAGDAEELRVPLGARLLQPKKPALEPGDLLAQNQPAGKPGPEAPGKGPAGEAKTEEEKAGLIGPVQIELLPGLDVLVLRGRRQDVQKVMEIIERIEKLSKETEPAIEVYHLVQVDNSALSTLVRQLYSEIFALRQGTVSITPLIKPNALLVIGRREAVDHTIKLIKLLDVPITAGAYPQVFRLKHASASAVQTVLLGLYPQQQRGGAAGAPTAPGGLATQGGLTAQVQITVDSRTNSLIVQAPPRELAEIAALVARIDVYDSDSINELKIFYLKHALATEVVQVLQDAVVTQGGSEAARAAGGQQRAPGGAAAPGAPAAFPGARTTAAGGAAERSAMLQFVTVDAQGQRRLTSGILTDVTVTSDASANAVIVAAPVQTLGLIEALIKQLDQPPAIRAEVKVFEIKYASAASIGDLLVQLFVQQTTGAVAGPFGLPLVTTAGRGEGETSLVQLRFAMDVRTNTIIASGTASDLSVVHAIIMRLDSADVRSRKTVLYRLKNVPAADTATSLIQFLQNDRTLDRNYVGSMASPSEQIEREVVIVPEIITNSLIVSSTPKFFNEIEDLIKKLDERPPMVVIQVLIAEVELHDTDEFGVELGLQDKILFDRVLGGFTANPTVGTQGVTNFALNRTNSDLGFGGLVFSASSESVNVMLRALKESRRLEVLSRPQITTLNNQIAKVMVGQRVPTITSATQSTFGQTNSVDLTDVGVILQVTPRVSPDGLVVMEIDAIRSAVGPEAEGIPIFVSTDGTIVRAPRINITTALTTVSAANGQTVLLGGLIQKDTITIRRRVPYLSDVPLLGNVFRWDLSTTTRRELLIIMTPHVVYSEQDADRIKKVEAARMHWCLSDAIDLHGDFGVRGRRDEWSDAEVPAVYPDLKPTVEKVPTPAPAGKRLEVIPPQPPAVGPVVAPPGGSPPPAPGVDPRLKPLPGGGGAFRPPLPENDRNRPQPALPTSNERGGPSLVAPAAWEYPQDPAVAVPVDPLPATTNPLRGSY